MNRQLTCQIALEDSATMLSHELVHLGFINEVSIRLEIFVDLMLTERFFSLTAKKLQK